MLQWSPEIHSEITSMTDVSISIDLQGSDDGLHTEAECRDGKLYWDCGDVWDAVDEYASIDDIRSKLESSAWTEKDRPGVHIFIFTDTMVSGGDIQPAPFTMSKDYNVDTNLYGSSAVGKVSGGEISWDFGKVWVPIHLNSDVLTRLEGGRWTEKKDPGRNVYQVIDGTAQGGDLEPTKFSVRPDGKIVAKLRGTDNVGTMQDNGDITWAEGGEGRWLRLASEEEIGRKLEGIRWTEETQPFVRTFTVIGFEALGGDSPAPFGLYSDNGVFLKSGSELFRGTFRDDGEIHWRTNANDTTPWIWVTIDAIEEMLSQIDGKRWTTKSRPGESVYTVEGYSISGGGIAAKFVVLPDRSIVSAIAGRSVGRLLDNGDIHWSEANATVNDTHVWLPLADPEVMLQKLEGKEWTEASEPGELIYTVSDDMVDGGGVPAFFVMLTDGTIYTGLGGGSLRGQLLQTGEIHWDGNQTAWVTMEAIGRLRARMEGKRFTGASKPGQSIYTVSDGLVFGSGVEAELELLPSGHVHSGLPGKSSGQMLDSGEIVWEGGAERWLPVAPAQQASMELEGITWAESGAAGNRTLVVKRGKVLADGADVGSIVLLENGTVVMSTDKEVIAGTLSSGNGVVWNGDRGSWVVAAADATTFSEKFEARGSSLAALIAPGMIAPSAALALIFVAAMTVGARVVWRRQEVRGDFMVIGSGHREEDGSARSSFQQVLAQEDEHFSDA